PAGLFGVVAEQAAPAAARAARAYLFLAAGIQGRRRTPAHPTALTDGDGYRLPCRASHRSLIGSGAMVMEDQRLEWAPGVGQRASSFFFWRATEKVALAL